MPKPNKNQQKESSEEKLDFGSPEIEKKIEVFEQSTKDGQGGKNLEKVVKKIDSMSKNKLWDEIGFHRPLAGFWHNLIYQIGVLIIPALVFSYLLKVLYPFPESQGYKDAFTGIFVLIFRVFDLGTSSTISRFIADENIKNPGKMVQYIQYFIWYQAVTGLLQISAISVWALFYAPNTELAYGIWIMLVCITKQYPGFPGVFKGVLNALQMFNKKNTIEFVQGEGIQIFTEIGFVLLGKWYGSVNPAIGPILGIAIGATFGLYLDDVIASFIAAYFLAKSLEDYGITFKRLFMIEFDMDLVKQCLFFGVKMGLPGVIFASTQMISLALSLQYIPQYTTFIALKGMAIKLVATTDRLVYQNFTPLYTEAYQNGKKKLCQYYNAHAYRFYMINTGFAVSIMLILIAMFEQIFRGVGLDRYLLTLPFLIPALIYRAFRPYEKYPSNILVAAHRPNQLLLINVSVELLKMLAWYLTIVVFKVYSLGIGGVIYTLVLTEFPVKVLKVIISNLYIHKTIFKMEFMRWQTFGVPIIATAVLYSVFSGFKTLVLDKLWAWSFWGTIIIAVLFLIILVFSFYFPLTVLLGGWDDNSVRDLRMAVKMSGPSKVLTIPMTYLVFKTVKISKLHNKYKYDESEAFKELKELIAEREINRKRFIQDSVK